jgi:hypothetical protein
MRGTSFLTEAGWWRFHAAKAIEIEDIEVRVSQLERAASPAANTRWQQKARESDHQTTSKRYHAGTNRSAIPRWPTASSTAWSTTRIALR